MRNCFDCFVETRYAEFRVVRTSLSLLGSVSSLVCFSFFWGGGERGVSEEEGKKPSKTNMAGITGYCR